MHGIKNNINSATDKYRQNRKLNRYNTHRTVSRYLVIVDGRVDSAFPSEKAAWKYAYKFTEECENEDEPWYPNIEIVLDQLESWDLEDEVSFYEWVREMESTNAEDNASKTQTL